MSAVLEQSAEELEFLVGATVKGVRVEEDEGEQQIVLTFGLKQPELIDGKPCGEVDYAVWEDPEGNGPGYLSLVGAR